MNPSPSIEVFRWRVPRHKFLGVETPTHDPDGSWRIAADDGWLAVVYPPDRAKAYVETIERAEVFRSFSAFPGNRGEIVRVTLIVIDSSIGKMEWVGEPDVLSRTINPKDAHTSPFNGTRRGMLTLPDGSRWASLRGRGFFEVIGLVHAYEAWRDLDLAEHCKVVTEVSLDAPDELRPLLAALPLLHFTDPPPG